MALAALSVSSTPLRHLLEHLGGDAGFDAVGHGGQSEIRAMGNQGGQEGREAMGHPGSVRIRPVERPREVTPRIHLGQEILDTDPGQGAFDGAAQVQDPRRELQRIALFTVQPAAANRREVVGRKPLCRLSRGRIKGVMGTGAEIVRLRWQLELGIGIRPLVSPPHGIID
jgi:hypothetical protein